MITNRKKRSKQAKQSNKNVRNNKLLNLTRREDTDITIKRQKSSTESCKKQSFNINLQTWLYTKSDKMQKLHQII